MSEDGGRGFNGSEEAARAGRLSGNTERRQVTCPKCGDEFGNLPVHLRNCDGEVATDGGGRRVKFEITGHSPDADPLYKAAVKVAHGATDGIVDREALYPQVVQVSGSENDRVVAGLDLGKHVDAKEITVDVADGDVREPIFQAAEQAVADHFHDVLAEGLAFTVDRVESGDLAGEDWHVAATFVDENAGATVMTDGGDDLGGHDYQTKTVRVHERDRGMYTYLMLTQFNGEGALLGQEGWRGEYIWYSVVSRNKAANVAGADPFDLCRRYPDDWFHDSVAARLMKDLDMDRTDFEALHDGQHLTPEDVDRLAGRDEEGDDQEVATDGGRDIHAGDTERSWVNEIHQGDAAETLAEMPESSVHCVMTSPPYFGHRDYGVDGQIGLEDSLDEYIDELLDVADELRRVLRDDGSWWLNLGDSFAGSGGAGGQWGENEKGTATRRADPGEAYNGPLKQSSFQRKTKMLIPHRVAIALEDAGWIVRADVVWYKPNGMPSSAHDRLNEQKEFLFHLTPEPQYWSDLDAIREPHAESSLKRAGRHDQAERGFPGNDHTLDPAQFCHPNGKNPGDVLEVTVGQFPEAHFAVYPEDLCETPIKFTCPPEVCVRCGAPYEHVTEEIEAWKVDEPARDQLRRAQEIADEAGLTEDHFEAILAYGWNDTEQGQTRIRARLNDDETLELAEEAKEVLGGYFREFTTTFERSLGYQQACDCDTDETAPGIVLDPFSGAGTTCKVAKDLGRQFIGIDLNPEYVAMSQKRVGVTVDEPEWLLDDDAQQTLLQADGGRNSRSLSTGSDQTEVEN